MEGAAIFGLSIPCSFHYPSDHPPPLRSFPGRLYLKLCQFPFHTAMSNCVAVVHISISVCKEKDHNLPICKQLVLRRCLQNQRAQAINNLAYSACLPLLCRAWCSFQANLGWLAPGRRKQEFLQNAAFTGYLFANFCLSTSVGGQGPFGAETSTSQDHRRTTIVMLKDRFLWCTNISTLLTYKVNSEGKRH